MPPEPDNEVHDYLQHHSQTSETYQEAWSALYTIAGMWPEDVRPDDKGERKERDLVGVLEDYLEGRLLKKKGWWSQGDTARYTACRSWPRSCGNPTGDVFADAQEP